LDQPGEELQLEAQQGYDVQLVHAEAGSRVVLVQLRRGDQPIDAALGEASTAEEAEDRARQRLLARLGSSRSPRPAPANPVAPPRSATPAPVSTPAQSPTSPPSDSQSTPKTVPAPPPLEEPPADPEDWSSELAQLDLQLRRLGWDREQEGVYLERVFGHPNRNRLTSYSDLLAYLQALEAFGVGEDPATAPAPLRRRELLNQCDQLLGQLRWDPSQGRAFLEQHFSLASRQQLSDAELLEFNMLLESEWLSRTENAVSD
jgi:hypothetical protein